MQRCGRAYPWRQAAPTIGRSLQWMRPAPGAACRTPASEPSQTLSRSALDRPLSGGCRFMAARSASARVRARVDIRAGAWHVGNGVALKILQSRYSIRPARTPRNAAMGGEGVPSPSASPASCSPRSLRYGPRYGPGGCRGKRRKRPRRVERASGALAALRDVGYPEVPTLGVSGRAKCDAKRRRPLGSVGLAPLDHGSASLRWISSALWICPTSSRGPAAAFRVGRSIRGRAAGCRLSAAASKVLGTDLLRNVLYF